MQGHLPGHFVAGLVETGEGSACIGLFELGVDIPLLAILALEDAAAVLAADLTLVRHTEGSFAWTNGMWKSKADIVLRLGNNLGIELLGSRRQGRFLRRELLGVEPEDRCGFCEAQVDLNCSGEGVLVGNDGQVHAVSQRSGRVGRKAQRDYK